LVNGVFACSWIQAAVTTLDDVHEQNDTVKLLGAKAHSG
jgi:hypothetical protein